MNKVQDNVTIMALSKENLVPLIKETLSSDSPFVLTVTGYSMRPTLKSTGDKVELVSTESRPVKKGEIVFFERENGDCVLHRVIRIQGNTLTINGDAQAWTEMVDVSRVIGVVSRFNRNGKWIDCDGFMYHFYSKFWMISRPLRRVTIKVKGLLSR